MTMNGFLFQSKVLLGCLLLLLTTTCAQSLHNSASFQEVRSTGRRVTASTSIDGFSFDPKDSTELKKVQSQKQVKISLQDQQADVTHASLSHALRQGHLVATHPSNTANAPSHASNPETRRLRGQSNAIHRRTSNQQCDGVKKIIQCNDGVEESTCKDQLLAEGVQVVTDMPNTRFFAVCVNSEVDASLIASLTDIAGVEDDPVRTPSVMSGSKVDRRLSEEVTPYGVALVKAPEFWSQYGTTGEGVTICVIDSGLRTTHEDIRDIASISGSSESTWYPWDEDEISHGTHVTGTIAAQENSVGVVGVAPGVSIHLVRVFDDYGYFTASDLVEAMNECANVGANIISMSLGGSISSTAEEATAEELESQGILLVASAGNDGDYYNDVNYPASYPAVMSVGAINESMQIASFSTHNPNVDIAAPGVAILSSTSYSDTSYAEYDGTSMAAPHVSASAALLWSKFPEKSVSEIRSALEESALDLGACGKDRLFGHGLIDVMAAADYLDSGAVASEISGCVRVQVELLTDIWGSETSYHIAPKDETENYVFRGGPYPVFAIATYTDEFYLPEGCYTLTWLDSYGDGCDGSLSVTFGSEQMNFNGFSGYEAAYEIGNCNLSSTSPPTAFPTTSPTSYPTSHPTIPGSPGTAPPTPTPPISTPTSLPTAPPPGSPPTSAPVPIQGSLSSGLCTPGEGLAVGVSLTTDLWSRTENALYFYDDSAPEDEFIWSVPFSDFKANTDYEGWVCLDPEGCYKFVFFDTYGDGLVSGGLELTEDGVQVLQINESELNSWYYEFGKCHGNSK